MKLYLTSEGLTNDTLVTGLEELAGKKISESKVLFVPTAANLGVDDKSWLVRDITEFAERKPLSFDLIDIAGLPASVWQPHFSAADIICVGGGDETYLSRIFREQNVKDFLLPLLDEKVYMGISAGSMVTGVFLPKGLNVELFEEESESDEGVGMELYDFIFLPHLNSKHFPNLTKETLDQKRDRFTSRVIATDDFTAIKIQDQGMDFVGDGERWEYQG